MVRPSEEMIQKYTQGYVHDHIENIIEDFNRANIPPALSSDVVDLLFGAFILGIVNAYDPKSGISMALRGESNG